MLFQIAYTTPTPNQHPLTNPHLHLVAHHSPWTRKCSLSTLTSTPPGHACAQQIPLIACLGATFGLIDMPRQLTINSPLRDKLSALLWDLGHLRKDSRCLAPECVCKQYTAPMVPRHSAHLLDAHLLLLLLLFAWDPLVNVHAPALMHSPYQM